ncbi:hypothetical protein [Aliterella atlantica]|uniref:hypothetical protein n=1 Tax=Aliterella atlantica TaxID=1827278 RepID=UPI001185FCA2|nr:hypothetical protein [Aliterella atlantica]
MITYECRNQSLQAIVSVKVDTLVGFAVFETCLINKAFICGSPQGMGCLVVGVSSSDRRYCCWLRCYQVTGGVEAVPRSAALLL